MSATTGSLGLGSLSGPDSAPVAAHAWAAVALKSPQHAKSRLAAVLTPDQRRRLLFVLAERVIAALRMTPGIDRIAVVTSSSEVAGFAVAHGAYPILQAEEGGTAAAFAAAAHALPAQRLLMVAGDLPCVSSAAFAKLLAAGRDQAAVLVPDRHRRGTNALLCSPPELLAPCFGDDSLRRHLQAAAALGVSAPICEIDQLAFDLDTPDDLQALHHWDAGAAAALLAVLYDAPSDLRAEQHRAAVTG